MIVVVALELAEHGCGVALIDDQDVVKQFAADSADEALGDRVRSRCPNRGLDDSDVDGGEDGIEAGSELAVAVADQEPEAPAGVVEVHQQVARELSQPSAGGVGGHAEDVYATGGVFDDEERVELVQVDRVEVEQVAGEDAVGLCAEELGPGRTGPPWRAIDACGGEDLPDDGGADLVAESGELPWRRRYPQRGFSVARRTISARTPAGMAGRPGRMWAVIQRRRRADGASAGWWLV
jgi:hypothetical protein